MKRTQSSTHISTARVITDQSSAAASKNKPAAADDGTEPVKENSSNLQLPPNETRPEGHASIINKLEALFPQVGDLTQETLPDALALVYPQGLTEDANKCGDVAELLLDQAPSLDISQRWQLLLDLQTVLAVHFPDQHTRLLERVKHAIDELPPSKSLPAYAARFRESKLPAKLADVHRLKLMGNPLGPFGLHELIRILDQKEYPSSRTLAFNVLFYVMRIEISTLDLEEGSGSESGKAPQTSSAPCPTGFVIDMLSDDLLAEMLRCHPRKMEQLHPWGLGERHKTRLLQLMEQAKPQ